VRLNLVREEFTDMVNSVVDRSEQRQLAALFEVLDALSDSRLADDTLHRSVRHWQVILQSRAAPDGEPSGDHSHPDLV
jgi:hypothetical protein